jgi:hypothetical protein
MSPHAKVLFGMDYSAFVDKCGGLQEAADKLGITYDAMRLRRSKQRRKAERGELGYKPVLPGFAVKSVASKTDDGAWVKQVKAHGEKFEVPAGHAVKGVSALVDGDDLVINKWVKTDRDAQIAETLANVVRASFNDFVSRHEPVACPVTSRSELLTRYVVGDHHLGLLAWKPETGDSYDLKIGEKLLRDKMTELVAATPDSRVGLFTNLGDFFHSNNARNRTEKSGAALDVDGRYGKVLQVGIRLATDCIHMLLAKHETVIVEWLIGNHDPEIALSALLALWAWFRDEPRVKIDFNPSKFSVNQHGKVMLVATHGDTLKPNEVAGFSAAKWPTIWGATTKRYAALGHVHHKALGGEANGLAWESFQTLAAKDAWHASEGYQSDRSMTAITYHERAGEFSRNRVSV